MATHACTFIAGDDEFLVTRSGKEAFEKLCREQGEACTPEVIDAQAQNVSEVEVALQRFNEAVQTLSLFGDAKVVWLKHINFISDSVTGRSEGAKNQLAWLLEILETLDPATTKVLVTAFPVDRRRKEFKALQALSHSTFLENDGKNQGAWIESSCDELEVTLTRDAKELLLAKTGGQPRLIVQELNKLRTYLGKAGRIEESHILELVPDAGESDFFEVAEAFYKQNLNLSLQALKRHFFNHKEARPLLSTLQGRNRLMIQLKALLDAGTIRVGPRGIDKTSFDSAQRAYSPYFGGDDHKTNANVFTQNTWYLGKLAEQAKHFSLRKLVRFQQEFTRAFEQVLARPQEQEAVMRELAIRCLS
ncbi:MAG: DNA polymerase III subunit delta [Pseudomonadales bacterium]|nr:DNA polymerase III subunit delta [Pseudomonadales bacterium]